MSPNITGEHYVRLDTARMRIIQSNVDLFNILEHLTLNVNYDTLPPNA